MGRQVELRWGSTTLDLNDSTYVLQANGGFTSAGSALEIKVLVQPATLTALDRLVAPVRRLLTAAALYDSQQVGRAVYVYTKVCDDISTTAEVGATWLRKRVRGGNVVVSPLTGTAAQPAAFLSLSLEVEDTWRRAAPESLLVASATPTVRSDGGLTMAAGATLTARRVTWTAATGLTVRVRWLYSDNDCTFFFAETGANDMKALYLASDNKLHVYDDGGNSAASAALTATAGDELDLVFKWDPITPKLGIWVNGMANGSAAAGTLDAADTYQVFAPSTVSQNLLSWQLWPAALTDAQCAGLNAWGRPEPELACVVVPADLKTTNAAYRFYNVPGEAEARLRMLLSDATQAFDQFRVGLRPLRIQTATKWECEDGTNGTDVLDAADATASSGNVAQFTPTATTYATRSTLVLAANPADMAAYYGQYRLLLALKDNAAAVGTNIIKWRLNCAGRTEDYSAEYWAATVATYSLLDLGTLTLPPGAWPEEMESCTTDVHAGSYLTLEIAIKNTVGAGGGTLNLDAVYLLPVELEGVVEDADLTTSQYLALDFASDPPAWVGVADARSLEYAHWAEYTGDMLTLAPVAGDAGLAQVCAYRDTAEKFYPNDTVTVWWFLWPGWL